jgi:chromosome segregation ATPase
MAGTQRLSPNTLNIRLGELHRQRIDLEERIRPLRLRLLDLTEQLGLASNRVTEDRRRLRDATLAPDYRGLTSTTNINLRQSNLGIALREEVYKIKQHYANNTTNSEACRRSEARLAKLHERLDRRRSQALNALTTQEERAERAHIASRDAYSLINIEIASLTLTLRELETALSAIVDEEARLNRGRGRKRQRRSTQRKRHSKKH